MDTPLRTTVYPTHWTPKNICNTPTRQCANTPTRQCANTSTRQRANTPTRQHANTPIRQYANTPIREKKINLIPCLQKSEPDCYNFSKTKGNNRIYFDILAGGDYAARALSAKGDEANNYLALRNQTETVEPSWIVGARASLVTPSGISVRSGIYYSQIHERFDYSGRQTIITIDTVNGMPRIDTVTGTLIQTTYNKLKTLDIPFLLGYEMQLDKWTLSANAGFALNLRFRQRGFFLNPNGQVVNFSSGATTPYPSFKSNAGISLLANISLAYKLSDKLELLLEPNIRIRPNSLTNEAYPLEQKYQNYGLMTGLRFIFD